MNGEGSTLVTVSLANSDYDKVCPLAAARGVSLPKVCRVALHRLLRDELDDDVE